MWTGSVTVALGAACGSYMPQRKQSTSLAQSQYVVQNKNV